MGGRCKHKWVEFGIKQMRCIRCESVAALRKGITPRVVGVIKSWEFIIAPEEK